MYVRIVTFALAGITADDYHRHAAAVAEAFTAWPGLLGKVWLGDRDRNRYGGVYLFATKVDADRSRSTPLFAGLAANPAFTDLAIEEYETLPEATAVTWPGLRGPTAQPGRVGEPLTGYDCAARRTASGAPARSSSLHNSLTS